MAITSGFFNSYQGDRVYDANQFSTIFDGIINDGVYASQGSCFVVNANVDMTLTVGSGRAWFNHTWTLNDSPYPIIIDPSEISYARIDAVVLKIDPREGIRKNTIEVVKGEPSADPQKPDLSDTTGYYYYPLAYVTVGANVSEITQADIENAVGTDDCPFVTGIIEHVSAETFLTQFQSEITAYMDGFEQAAQTQFENWFSNLQTVLDDNVAANLQAEIDDIAEKEFNMYYDIETKTAIYSPASSLYGSTSYVEETVPNVMTAISSISYPYPNENQTVILTNITPVEGVWKYAKKYVIESGVGLLHDQISVSENYIRISKDEDFPSGWKVNY